MTPVVPSVGLIGGGAVGQSVGGAVVAAGLCARLLIASRTPEQAAALADDLDDMRAALSSPVRPCAVEVADLRDSAAVVVVTNPVDLMTRLWAEFSGCSRVFGIGSSLDTARYRLTLARLLDVPVEAVCGQVIGEHGDAAVVCASSTTVNGLPVPVPLQEVRHELATRPGRISAGTGRTRCGPAGAVVSTLRLALGVEDGTTELCALHEGGWLGIPVHFAQGRPLPFLPPLDAAEARQLEAARAKLRTAYQAVCGVPLQPLPSRRNS